VVTSTTATSDLVIVVEPNCSASWQANKFVLLCLSLVSLAIAAGFALIGAWPILPFAGLELACLGAALYYVNWKLHFRHVITVGPSQVRIDKGHYRPRTSYCFERHKVRLAVIPETHPWDGPSLSLHDNHDSVCVGEFLNREDSLQLLAALRRELPVGTHSSRSERQF
jgi:uncharacterized membrane protein